MPALLPFADAVVQCSLSTLLSDINTTQEQEKIRDAFDAYVDIYQMFTFSNSLLIVNDSA